MRRFLLTVTLVRFFSWAHGQDGMGLARDQHCHLAGRRLEYGVEGQGKV
jgi:hypothetical protein